MREASGQKRLGNLRFRSGEQGLAIRIDLDGDLGHFGNLFIADRYFQHEASMCGWILLVENKIAEAVSHPAPAILLEWLNDMRMAAHDKVGPGVNHLPGQLFLLARGSGGVLHAPVRADHHQIGKVPGEANICRNLLNV